MIINSNNKRTFQIVLFVLIGLVALGVGYAGTTAVDLIVNGHGLVTASQANFIVHFISTTTSPKITTGTGTAWIDRNDDTIASFEVTGLSKKGDTAVATYTVKNDSNDIGADVSIELEYTNCEWFKVTESIQDSQLKAGDSTTVLVTVELLKTPVDEDISTVVTGRLISNPIENNLAVGNDPISDSSPYISKSFSSDSWEAISYAVENKQLSKYKVGDTKKITIENKEYTLRVANIGTPEECADESYSETACGFVVEFVDIVKLMPMKKTNSAGGYTTSDVVKYLNEELYPQLPEGLKKIIADTRVVSGHGSNDSSDYVMENQKLFLLSAAEIMGPNSFSNDSTRNKTSQLEYYKNSGTQKVYYTACYGCGGCSTYSYNAIVGSIKKYNGYNNGYWLRNPDSSSSSNFTYVDTYGQARSSGYSANLGIVPAFRIK